MLRTVTIGLICLFVASGYAEDGLVGHWIFDATHVVGNTVEDLAGDRDGAIEGRVVVRDAAGLE